MKKILIINDYITGGGAEKLMKNMIEYLDKNDYHIHVLTEYSYDGKVQYLKNIKHICMRKKMKNSFFSRLMNKIKEKARILQCSLGRYDTVISMKEGPCMKWCSSIYAKKRIGFVLVDYQNYYWTQYAFNYSSQKELECMKSLSIIICISESIRENLIKTIGYSDNFIVKYPPINESECINLSREKIELPFKYNKQKTIFISVGRFVETKGYSRLLEIAIKLKNSNYDFELWLIGDGECMKEYSDFINIHELFDVVRLLGVKENPYKYMKLADWYVCSSLTEGFSTIIQESVAIGLPVISTNCSGTYELLGKGNEYGIITENTNESLLMAITEVLENPQLNEYYRKKTLKRFDFISLNSRMSQIEELF